jgi:hypothetical protein
MGYLGGEHAGIADWVGKRSLPSLNVLRTCSLPLQYSEGTYRERNAG